MKYAKYTGLVKIVSYVWCKIANSSILAKGSPSNIELVISSAKMSRYHHSLQAIKETGLFASPALCVQRENEMIFSQQFQVDFALTEFQFQAFSHKDVLCWKLKSHHK